MEQHIRRLAYTARRNDLRIGGKLFLRMELKDGSDGFDYICIYDEVIIHKKLAIQHPIKKNNDIIFY